MKEKIYTIKNLCNELNQPRQKVRRRIEKLDIKAINEDTRIHENEPLEYDHQAFLKLAKEFDVQINNTECTASVQHRTANEQHRTAEETSKEELVDELEKQLEEANKARVRDLKYNYFSISIYLWSYLKMDLIFSTTGQNKQEIRLLYK